MYSQCVGICNIPFLFHSEVCTPEGNPLVRYSANNGLATRANTRTTIHVLRHDLLVFTVN